MGRAIKQVSVAADKRSRLWIILSSLCQRRTSQAWSSSSRHALPITVAIGWKAVCRTCDVTRVLTEQGVNLEHLVTSVEPAPMSSETLFRAHAELGLPMDLSLDVLQQRLETLADDLMVELHLPTDE